MENEEKGKRAYQDLKCIWMSSNVVEYKLCDKNFDCENCSFDQVIRNLPGASNSELGRESVPGISFDGGNFYSGYIHNQLPEQFDLLDNIIMKLKDEVADRKLIYIKNQLVIKHLFSNTYYMGINPMLLHFIDNIKEVKDGHHSRYVNREEPILRLSGEWGEVVFTAPMNFLLLDEVNFTPSELLSNKWFGIIGVNQTEITTARISPGEWHNSHEKALNLLAECKLSFSSVGSTMMDGGKPVNYLYELLGKDKYFDLLKKLF